MIDHILVSSKWRGSITNARVYPSTDIGSDHQLLVANIRLKLKAGSKHKAVERVDVTKLCDAVVAAQYTAEICTQLNAIIDSCKNETAGSVDELWQQTKTAFNETSRVTLGTVKSRPEKAWLSAATWRLVDDERK